MNESNNFPMMYQTEAAVAALNKVPGFDPLKYLRRTKNTLKLDLPVQKLWFRMAHPNGPMRVTALRITEQMAIFEAQVFLDRSDVKPISVSVVQKTIHDGKEYIKSAQDEALSQALSDAGFGIQFTDVMTPAETTVPQESVSRSVQKAAHGASTAASGAKVKLPAEEAKTPYVASDAQREPVQGEVLPADSKHQEEHAPQAQQFPVNPEKPAEQLPIPEPNAEMLPASPVENHAQESVAQETTAPAAAAYTADMPVEEILKSMTLEQAKEVVVDKGICAGKTIAQIAKERPISLRFYLTPGNKNNVIHAAAQLVMDSLQKAG